MKDVVLEYLKNPDKKLVSSPRAGQLSMAEKVVQTIREGGAAFIQAPVGTGKSFAYLLPALLSGERTVVSTSNKALQRQLAIKDVPALEKAIGKKFSLTVLKGASNYYCELRAQALKNQSAKRQIGLWKDMGDFLGSYGDLETLFTSTRPDYADDVSVEGCEEKSCEHHKTCGYYALRQKALTDSVVITNHLLLAHTLVQEADVMFSAVSMAKKIESEGGDQKQFKRAEALKNNVSNVFGQYSTLIVDEAHQFPAALRNAQTATLARHVCSSTDKRYERAAGPASDKLLQVWKDWESALKPDEPFNAEQHDLQVIRATNALEGMLEGMKAARDAWTAEATRRGTKADRSDLSSLHVNLKSAAYALHAYEQTLIKIKSQYGGYVKSVQMEDFERGAKTITVQPINPGAKVRRRLQQIPSMIFTSATLAPTGDFEHIARDCGVGSKDGTYVVRTLSCPTPFNYHNQALLYAPQHIPHAVTRAKPGRAEWVSAVASEIARLVDASAGNTFVLFSATQDMQDVAREISQLNVQYPIICQDAGQAHVAETAYRTTPNAVLFGLRSFFEGVSIEGDKLWSVIIPKLPFPVPTDPLVAAKTAQEIKYQVETKGRSLKDAEYRAFEKVMLNEMLFSTMQGAGRLIRTTTDRGVLTILDPRIWTGSAKGVPKPGQEKFLGYGLKVYKALGYTNYTAQFDDVAAFFTKLRTK